MCIIIWDSDAPVDVKAGLTCNDLWSLEVFVGVNVAGRQSQKDPHQQKQEIRSTPHASTLTVRNTHVSKLIRDLRTMVL